MSRRNHEWSDAEDWQEAYFGLPVRNRLPRGYRSFAMTDAIEQEKQRQQREEQLAADIRAHVRRLVAREQVERLRPLVQEFGAEKVERILKITLPAELKKETK
jgi:hypothetical protein